MRLWVTSHLNAINVTYTAPVFLNLKSYRSDLTHDPNSGLKMVKERAVYDAFSMMVLRRSYDSSRFSRAFK
jgi:hypothetical protein